MSINAQQIDPDFLVNAYASGVFPMAMDDGEIGWFAPDPRGIIPLDTFHIPHGMKQVIENPPFEMRIDTDFEAVMRGCADRSETWINESIIATYVELHRRGCAHSIEAWEGDELVGGLYGVALGAAFFGESMFSRKSEASKLCLVHLVGRMRARGYTLLDTQWTNPHLDKFGAVEIPKSQYHRMLAEALDLDVSFVDEHD
ncbi:MAG: leucyl/phenylalanyl-tRNA--protein transferase [Verrucomicrobiales bacterium]|jgi:leucyl/phenylalanyl-tRNA--protein transferase